MAFLKIKYASGLFLCMLLGIIGAVFNNYLTKNEEAWKQFKQQIEY